MFVCFWYQKVKNSFTLFDFIQRKHFCQYFLGLVLNANEQLLVIVLEILSKWGYQDANQNPNDLIPQQICHQIKRLYTIHLASKVIQYPKRPTFNP